MKNSRKIKKFLVSVLTVTLSIIMFVTQAAAANIVSYLENFELEGIVDSYESMGWNKNRNMFSFGIDLTCYECDNVENVEVNLGVVIGYNSSIYEEEFLDSEVEIDYGTFTYLDTEDSDELNINFTNFVRGYSIIFIYAEIIYQINYTNSESISYKYIYSGYVINDSISYTRSVSNDEIESLII